MFLTCSRSTLTRRGAPVARRRSVASRPALPLHLTIQADLINCMSNLPKYFFGDIPAEVMKEIMDEMQALKPEPSLHEIERLESSPGWFTSVAKFLSDVRAEYR